MTTQPHDPPRPPSPAASPGAATSGCPFPPGAVPLGGPRFQNGPDRLYRQMRRTHGSVAPVLLDGDVPAWLVLGYRELHRVTSNPALFSRDSGLWNAWHRIPPDWPLLPMIGHNQNSVLYAVGDEHRRRSGTLSDVLSAVDPFELRDHAEKFADRLIDVFCGAGEADLVADYAKMLPVLVLARLYGFSDADGPGLARAANDVIDGMEAAIQGHWRLETGMYQLVADKRAAPAADVVSRMLAHPAAYTDEEMVEDLMVLLVAGHQPTADWIGNSLRLMLTDDRFAASLSGGRHSVRQAMNEVLWEDTPTQNVAGRWATRDTQLGGQRIHSGDLVLLGLAAANADPQVRPDAEALPSGNSAFFSFGHGDHRCPYPAQEIAEVIAKAGIEVLLDRLPDVDLAVPGEALAWRPSPWLRGLSALPVQFTPTSAVGGEK